MAKRKKLLRLLLGILIGLFLSHFFTTSQLIREMCLKASNAQTTLTYLEEENHRSQNKSLIFVGVMTAAQYLDTRAKAVYETWGKEVPGKILFFSSEQSRSDQIPLIPLPKTDDSYPPQRKSFMMLKYMYDHFLDQYEWFLRADDDVYIKTDLLENLLKSVDSKKPWFIGQTGRGNTEEFGLLSLDSDENFCMGGPGVILSRETLKRMAPFVEECLNNLYTTHEDVELGRCVRRFAGISCTWSYEMQVIFYHNQSGQAAFTGDLKQKEVHQAITLHPVKQPQYMYRLHNYVKGLGIQQKQQEMLYLHRGIVNSMAELNYRHSSLDEVHLVKDLPLFPEIRGSDDYLGNTRLLGVAPNINRYTPHHLQDVLEWEMISKSVFSQRDFNPRKRLGSSLKEGLSDVVREIMDLINSYSKQRGRIIEYKDILYGYWRLNPIHGVDLILDLLLVYRKYRGHKMTVQVRRHSYVQQTFSGIFIREIPDSQASPPTSLLAQNFFTLHSTNEPAKKVVNFLVPLCGRFETFTRFLRVFEQVCLKDDEDTSLLVILYEDDKAPEDLPKSVSLLKTFQVKYFGKIKFLQVNETFARGKALQHGVDLFEDNDLLLFIDVDMVFDTSSLDRIRKNTLKNHSVYFPIVYSQFKPHTFNNSMIFSDTLRDLSKSIDNSKGFWRQFGFGIVSLYKSDYNALGGFNLEINGWGNEDVTFYDKVVKSPLKFVRAIDIGLVHIYHSIECDFEHLTIEQKYMCLGTKASTLGATSWLQKVFKDNRDIFR